MDVGQPTRRDTEPSGQAGSAPPRTPTTPIAQGGPPTSLTPRAPRRARQSDQPAECQLTPELSRSQPGDAGRMEPDTPRAPQVQSRVQVTTPQSGKPVPQGSGSLGPLGPEGPQQNSSGSRSPTSTRAAPVPQPPPSLPEDTQFTAHQQRAGTTDIQVQAVEDFRVHLVTWNVGSAVPPDDLTSLLELNIGDGNTDMYIIGLQEVNSMINKRLKDVLFTDQWSEVFMDTLSPFGYVLVTSQRMQGVLLLVFAKYYHLPFLRGVQTESTRTGLGGYWGNKGGVSARMTVFGHPICFLNCHLPAHMENSEQRMEDFESILQQQQFEGQAATGVLDHDVVFWFGDLNFRIEDYDIQVVKSAIDSNNLSLLWEKDQLNMAKDSEKVLDGFLEGPLKFPPTYKFDVGTNTYDTSGKKRKPAWTDRILWRLRPASQLVAARRGLASGLTSGTRVTQYSYRSHMEYVISDHKPVSAIFTLQFPYKVDIPWVTLMVEDEWTKPSDATAKFKLVPTFSRSSWDWIGLYKVGFKHHKDYVGYVWAKQEETDFLTQEYQVTFAEEDLPKGSGDYILGYYSNNMSTIVGVTEPFQIQLPTSSPVLSPSDSSDFSSEDDSTMGLLHATSRSPSPSKGRSQGRRSRSRSPALPRLQGLHLGSRSPSPRTPTTGKKERLVCESDGSPASLPPVSPGETPSPSTPGVDSTAALPTDASQTGGGGQGPNHRNC
ncbi:inositol polyphosphate 5-phosphatase K [Paramormyrops kingsleyae]|uniref:inositol polyphosphate 5-phosphatase K n=1 Tax=Paramormyrops kingsleyae TaxID=1676925 RepID=UPI000CD5D022|nr:phosphatidylinositol 4,5-bisphosphate 5-phosphatase A-like [Paramormyrops kingsleyae]